jgi:hypothetical protein
VSDHLTDALGRVRQASVLVGKIAFHAPEGTDTHRAASRAASLLLLAERDMEQAGIEAAPVEASKALDLGELAAMTSGRSEALALIEVLSAALPLAERLDKARGRAVGGSVALQVHEVAGCDTADVLNDLRLRLLAEVGGARGKGLE